MTTDKTLNSIVKKLADLGSIKLEIGIRKTNNNLNLKAQKLEFGDNRTPPLGVFRSSIANHKTEWAKAFVETARMAIKGKCQTQESLEQLGKQVVSDLENNCLNLANRTKKLNPELAKELSEVADALSYQTRTKS